jgi:hypothetical protein
VHNTLDPLLEKLTRDYIDDKDLSSRLQGLFKVLPGPPLSFRLAYVSRAGVAGTRPSPMIGAAAGLGGAQRLRERGGLTPVRPHPGDGHGRLRHPELPRAVRRDQEAGPPPPPPTPHPRTRCTRTAQSPPRAGPFRWRQGRAVGRFAGTERRGRSGSASLTRPCSPRQDFSPPIHLTDSDFAVMTQVRHPPPPPSPPSTRGRAHGPRLCGAPARRVRAAVTLPATVERDPRPGSPNGHPRSEPRGGVSGLLLTCWGRGQHVTCW